MLASEFNFSLPDCEGEFNVFFQCQVECISVCQAVVISVAFVFLEILLVFFLLDFGFWVSVGGALR